MRREFCNVKCTHCGHVQRHAFNFGNPCIPLWWYEQSYDFNAWCTCCHRQFTAVFHKEMYQEVLGI